MWFHTVCSLIATYIPPFLLTYLIISLLRNKFNALRNIPGPAIAAYTRLWRVWYVQQGQAHQTSLALHRKHGKLVRLAPHVVSVSDVDEISKIYNIKGDFAKTGFYPISSIVWDRRPQMNLFSTRDEAEHREMKRRIANSYTLESLLRAEPAIDERARVLLGKLGDFADRHEAVDLGMWLHYYAFDVVGELSFDQSFGFLEKGGDIDNIIATIAAILSYSAIIGQVPEAHKYLLGNPVLPIIFKNIETYNQIVMFTLKAINTRTKLNKNGELELNESRDSYDMLTKWAAVKSRDPLKMSTRDIMVGLTANVFAGADTTSIALRAILYYLIKNPDTMTKLLQEIDDADRAGELGAAISDKEARSLPYLNAVLREAMRLHPSVGLMLERNVPPSGATICGQYLPGGTIVGVNPWVTQYDPEIFEDPETFRPERWLDPSPDRKAAMDKAFFNFGAGSRVCIGQQMSLIEMRKIIPLLLREFEIRFEGGREQEWKVKNVWFVQQELPLCRLKRRARAN